MSGPSPFVDDLASHDRRPHALLLEVDDADVRKHPLADLAFVPVGMFGVGGAGSPRLYSFAAGQVPGRHREAGERIQRNHRPIGAEGETPTRGEDLPPWPATGRAIRAEMAPRHFGQLRVGVLLLLDGDDAQAHKPWD